MSSGESRREVSDASGREPRAVVRLRVIDRRALGNDAGRIDPLDRPVIDHVVARLDGRGDARDLVELAHVVEQVRVVGDALPVAFEQREIRDVEAHQRRKQPPVGLGDLPPDQIALAAEPRLELVEDRLTSSPVMPCCNFCMTMGKLPYGWRGS